MTNPLKTPAAGEGWPPSASTAVGLDPEVLDVGVDISDNDYRPSGLVRVITDDLIPAMPDAVLWFLACEVEIEMVRRRREECESSRAMGQMYSYSGPSFVELQRRRSTYTTPALTPEEIRAKASTSWASYELRRAAA